ncbi:MAG: type 3 dihydrofolate reductase [Gammaproteobacteria bacterium]|nr:MAG: type 3 dihydrofolate reductase [Gammaproteobacteria bacterium]
MPRINLIAAMAKGRTIGRDNKMPWHLPADLKHFKATTLKHPVIMGRKTYQSIGKALPGRRNIVVTRDDNFQCEDAEVVHDLDEAVTICGDVSDIMIIGGANIYEQMLSKATRLYLTFIDLAVDGDSYFPDWTDLGFEQVALEAHLADEKNKHDYQFVTFERQVTKYY